MPRSNQVRFLKGREVWTEAKRLVRDHAPVTAVISYFAKDAAELLPLNKGDTLVVDMSLLAVRQGITNPKELEKLRDKGVTICSRSNLHAKFIIAGPWLLTGSANASHNSVERLDEAAVLTNSPAAVAAAKRVAKQWASEPILDSQLEEAIREYRPPTFKGIKGGPRRKSVRRGNGERRLWVVGGLVRKGIPEEEESRAEHAEEQASRGFRKRPRGEISHIHYGRQVGFMDELRRDDWLIQSVEGSVIAPARVAGVKSYPRGGGKRRWLVVIEERSNAPEVSWAAFKRAAKRSAGLTLQSRRTKEIRGQETIDHILTCWSPKTGQPLKKFFGR